MSMNEKQMTARARALIGVSFKAQGRDAALGLDCVGLVAAAAAVPMDRLRGDYDLRSQELARIEQDLRDFGCRRLSGNRIAEGDIVVCTVGPSRYHLALCTGASFIHADAVSRQVVERPFPLPWPIISMWRLVDEEDD